DKSKNCALYDLGALKSFCDSKSWSNAAFQNPKTREISERIRIIGIDRLGSTSLFATCPSISSFQELATVSSLREFYWPNYRRDISAPTFSVKFLPKLSDEEAMNWLGLFFRDKWLSMSLLPSDINHVLERGCAWMHSS